MTVITDWTSDKAAAFGRETLQFHHGLHQRPMFSDDALAEMLDRYPRERLGVFTMGHDLKDWRSWRRGVADRLSGAELMQAVRNGRIWLNLRHANEHLPEYAALCEEVFADKEAHVAGLRTFRRDLGILISSPSALVFYHLDVPLSSLWQIRGSKRIWFYPRREPFVADEQIERFVTQEAEGQFPFQPEWDAAAKMIELNPGDMVTWAQNAPHRVENGDMVNVSLSMEFMTPAAVFRANIMYANALLRRRFGATPKIQERPGPVALGKLAIARAAKASKRRKKVYRPILPPTFTLDPAEPGVLQPPPMLQAAE